VPPGWRGEAPSGETVIECPTMVATVVGRIACDGAADLPVVAALQQGLRLSPVNPGAALAGVPDPAQGVPAEIAFYEQLRTYMAAFPPPAPDLAYQQRFAPLGLLDRESPFTGPLDSRGEALAAGLKAAKQALEQRVSTGGAVAALIRLQLREPRPRHP
jgi:hypothetical protein